MLEYRYQLYEVEVLKMKMKKSRRQVENQELLRFATDLGVGVERLKEKDFRILREVYFLNQDLMTLITESSILYKKCREHELYITRCVTHVCKSSDLRKMKKVLQNEVCVVLEYNINALETLKRAYQRNSK